MLIGLRFWQVYSSLLHRSHQLDLDNLYMHADAEYQAVSEVDDMIQFWCHNDNMLQSPCEVYIYTLSNLNDHMYQNPVVMVLCYV